MKRLLVWLFTAALASLLFATGCRQSDAEKAFFPAELDSIVRDLEATGKRLENAFVIGDHSVVNSLQGQLKGYVSLSWLFPATRCSSSQMVVELWEHEIKEFEKIEKLTKRDFSDFFRDHEIQLSNCDYVAKLSKCSPSGRFIDRIVFYPERINFRVPYFSGNNLYLVNGFSLQQLFKEHKMSNLEVDSDGEDLIRIHFSGETLKENMIGNEWFRGSWDLRYSKSQKMLVQQTFQGQAANESDFSDASDVVYQVKFAFEDSLNRDNPSEMISSIQVWETGSSKRKEFEQETKVNFLYWGKHNLPAQGCYLSFHDMQEVPGIESRTTLGTMAIASLVGFFVALVIFIVCYRSRKN